MENECLLQLFAFSFKEAEWEDPTCDKLNKGIVALMKTLVQTFGVDPEMLVVCGSTREGMKVTRKGEVGDIDVMFVDPKVKVEEKNFIYNEDFPCHCNVLFEDDFVNADWLYYGSFADLRHTMWDEANLHDYRTDDGLTGVRFDTLIGKFGDFSKSVYLFKKCARVVKDVYGSNFTPECVRESVPLFQRNIKQWEIEFKKHSYLNQVILAMQLLRVMRLLLNSSNLQEELVDYMKLVLFEDSTGIDTGVLYDLTSALTWFRGIPKFCVDWILAFSVEGWPRPAKPWIHRSPRHWPDQHIIDKIIKQGFNLVGKLPPNSGTDFHKLQTGVNNRQEQKDFYLSFSRAEILLCENLSEIQKTTFKIFKAIIKFGSGLEHVKSYYLKTIMFWVCEETDTIQWADEYLMDNLRQLIQRLFTSMANRNLPHYFIPTMNLLARVDYKVCTEVAENLTFIMENTENYLKKAIEMNGPFLIFKKVCP